MAKKRERLDVIRDILLAIRENKQIKPTRLLYASNLSPQMFKEYINELITKNFISLDIDQKEKKTFSLTSKRGIPADSDPLIKSSSIRSCKSTSLRARESLRAYSATSLGVIG